MPRLHLKGHLKLIQDMKASVGHNEERFHRGIIKAGELLHHKSLVLVPYATGELAESSGVRWEGDGFNTVVIVYYNTDYAVYVHENIENKHDFPTKAKFLEDPYFTDRDDLLKAIYTEMIA